MTTPPMLPRASLTTLPTEIKAKIVEMAFDSQEAWKKRDPEGFTAAFEPDDDETRSRWHPMSLMNKEFRELSVPHIFKVLHSHRTLHSDFRPRIYWKHRKHISRVVLQPTVADDRSLEDTFSVVLPGLANLRSVDVSYEASAQLFGDFASREVPTSSHKLRLASFQSFGYKLTRLALDCLYLSHPIGAEEEIGFLRAFKDTPLQSLAYSTNHGNPIESNTALEDYLNHHPQLRKLDLSATRDRSNCMAPSDLTAYADLVRSRDLEADFEDDKHDPFAYRAKLRYGEEEIEYLGEALLWIARFTLAARTSNGS
ncbi:hypothetical protein RQP46_003416 [Phenoliferia psychrophenolica]